MTGQTDDGIDVRPAGPGDAEALLALQQRLDRQTSFMLLEPDERSTDPGALRERLTHPTPGSVDLLALSGARAVGWLSVEVLPYRRARHVGYVVLGVDAEAAGRGLGGRLLEAAASHARAAGLLRLELTVMADNTRAIALYERHGFEREGVRRRAIRRGDEFVDELYMARLLATE